MSKYIDLYNEVTYNYTYDDTYNYKYDYDIISLD